MRHCTDTYVNAVRSVCVLVPIIVMVIAVPDSIPQHWSVMMVVVMTSLILEAHAPV